jgi:outer membrane protein
MSSMFSKRRFLAGAVSMLAMTLAPLGHATDEGISLRDAVRQAISSNLDLLARRRALAAAREEIGLARSTLLPQIDVGARGEFLDNDRPDSEGGNNTQESVLFTAKLTQSLYDEESWAGFDIQKYTYMGQVQQFAAFELGLIQTAAEAFLELERAQRLGAIQEGNREITRSNLSTSRARIAAGWSSEREILRWESQLAGNDADVRAAQVSVLQTRFELNRVRNLPPESAAAALLATVEEYGFVYAREPITRAIVAPETDRRMRDFLVRVGIQRSPDLATLDASIAGAKRQLASSRRAFWVPTLTFNAGIDHLEANPNSGDSFNATEWGVQGLITFPLVEGGAKLASRDQALQALASLRTQRRATAQTLSQTIRAAFAQASGAYETLGFAKREVEAARRNFELVDASYILGVDSILDLLDAQAQQLAAELSMTNATYDFLENLIAAERQIAFSAYLESPAEVEGLLDQLELELRRPPAPSEATRSPSAPPTPSENPALDPND